MPSIPTGHESWFVRSVGGRRSLANLDISLEHQRGNIQIYQRDKELSVNHVSFRNSGNTPWVFCGECDSPTLGATMPPSRRVNGVGNGRKRAMCASFTWSL